MSNLRGQKSDNTSGIFILNYQEQKKIDFIPEAEDNIIKTPVTVVDNGGFYFIEMAIDERGFKITQRDTDAGILYDVSVEGFLIGENNITSKEKQKLRVGKYNGIVTDNDGIKRYLGDKITPMRFSFPEFNTGDDVSKGRKGTKVLFSGTFTYEPYFYESTFQPIVDGVPQAPTTDFTALYNLLMDHINNTSNPHQVTKQQIGLGNVNNTADADKPVSTAQLAALDLKENLSNKDTDSTFAANSDTKYPSQKAVATALTNKVNKAGQPYTDPVTGDLYFKPSDKGIGWKDYESLAGVGNAPLGVNMIYESLSIGTRYRFVAGCLSLQGNGFEVKNGSTLLYEPDQSFGQGDAVDVDLEFVATDYFFSLEVNGAGMSAYAQIFALVDKKLNLTKFKEFDAKQNALGYTPENVANKDTVNGYVGISDWKIKFRNLANTFTSFFTNAATASRTYLFQDKDYTVAGLDDITTAINNLKDGVASPGDTLQKLYNLVLGAVTQVNVANIAARDAYNVPRIPFNIFVVDDGDGRWALYQATTTGVGATFVKLSDPDLLNAVMSAAQIKTAYESNSDTNAFTNALLAKLNGIAAGATANSSDATLLSRANHTGTQLANTISNFAATVWGLVVSATGWAATATGTNTYAASITPAPSSLTTDMEVTIRFTNANTGASTLNLNGTGAINIVKNGSVALAAGDISAGQKMRLAYDGTNWQIIGGGGGTLALTGDVTGSGSNSIATTIANNAVSFAKFAQTASRRIVGRISATTGNHESLTIDQVYTLLTNETANTTSGSLNNVSTNDLNYIRLTLATTITGFANPASGKIIYILNDNSVSLTITHEDTNSTAANRINTPGGQNLIVPSKAMLQLMYNNTNQRWFVVTNNGNPYFSVLAGSTTRGLQVNANGNVSAVDLQGFVSGNAVLVAGTVSFTVTGASNSSEAILTRKIAGGTLGSALVYSFSGSTMTISSVNSSGTIVTTDTSTIHYFVEL